MKTISLLGSTGSIGTQTLDVSEEIKILKLRRWQQEQGSKNWQHRHVNLSRNWSASAVKNWQAI